MQHSGVPGQDGLHAAREASGHPLWEATFELWSFNLRTEFAEKTDGPNGWSRRRDGIADFIQARRPAVVCVQEATARMLDYLVARLGEAEYGWVGTSRSLRANDEMAAFLFDRRAAEVVVHDTVWLAPEGTPRGRRGWDAACPRTLGIAVFRIHPTARPQGEAVGTRPAELLSDCAGMVRVLNTHFDHVGSEARRHSAELIAKVVLAGVAEWPDCAQVLAGDFNTPKGNSEEYRALAEGGALGSGLIDVARVLAVGDLAPFTIHKWHGLGYHGKHGDGTVDLSAAVGGQDGGRGNFPDAQHIDWVLWRNGQGTQLRPIRYEVITDRLPSGPYLSDHFPISVTFGILPHGGPRQKL